MLHCCAVVASNTEANTELIDDKINGLLYQCGNPSSLAEKIQQLYSDRKLLTCIAENSYVNAKKNYTMKAAVQHYIEIYNQLIDG